ncbi:metallophosphoesterase [Metabacillus fastidiosus]|uniref:metallophosphoesterase n=3 Tax=Metabacillus fastidiosus TaxID=1458 RepID=UPI003D2A9937
MKQAKTLLSFILVLCVIFSGLSPFIMAGNVHAEEIIVDEKNSEAAENVKLDGEQPGSPVQPANQEKEETPSSSADSAEESQAVIELPQTSPNDKQTPKDENNDIPKTEHEQPELHNDTVKDVNAPQISHEAAKNVKAFSSVKIEAVITDDISVPYASLYYKSIGEENFKVLPMNADEADKTKYAVEIPNIEADFVYYIEASDGINTIKTAEYTVKAVQQTVDYNNLPYMLVTELVPDTTNVGSADGYEFIEIYNNSDRDINFKDYKIQYRYGSDPESDIVWPSVPDDVVIPSKGTLVFWIINKQNGSKTVADFNANFKTNLVENKDIIRIYSDGMANGSMRGIIIATNTDTEIAAAYYFDEAGVDDTHANKGIEYKYPADHSNQMVKISAGTKAATPGTVDPSQVPNEVVKIEKDEAGPTVENRTTVLEAEQTDNIQLIAAANDNKEVKTVRLFYRNNEQVDYKEALLQRNKTDQLYYHKIYSPEIIGKEYIEYYFIVSDGFNETKSDTYKVIVNSNLNKDSLRLNINDGDILSGKKILKATSTNNEAENLKLFIDDKEVAEETTRVLEHSAYLAFEVSGINTYFQNGVTMGDDILYIFDDWIPQWETITVPVEADRLAVGENVITIRAGNKASPFDMESKENRDDYNLRNVRLVLSDGTILTDPKHSNPEKVFDMGDDGTYRPFENFTFIIPKEKAASKGFIWDTTTVADGKHTIIVKSADEEVKKKVHVDNSAPLIETTVIEGKEYKGSFEIDADITDDIAEVKEFKVLLDDKEIKLPYEASSGQMSPGEHKLVIIATDKVGNRAEKIVRFSVVNENPYKPELIAPVGNVNGNPKLKVRVTDPSNDELKVTFYKGFQYDASQTEHIKAYKNANDIEPPQALELDGEEMFTSEDRSLVSRRDGKYLKTNSLTQFPYHRFDVTVDSSVDADDIIELVWEGHSLEGRKVTMYAWSHIANKWTAINYKIAGKEDFTLKGNVKVSEFVKNNVVNVLVQDEIPASPDDYDYTFVWMSDTQYYSESYPYIYESLTHWIAKMEAQLKIKYVFHTGDIVNVSTEENQWKNADQFMKVLDDKQIPYGVLAGNHDVDQKTTDYTEYYKYFGENRFKDRPYYGGSYKNNRGHYDLISANGNDYIMVYLGWGIEDEGIAWVNEVLAAYPDRKAILNFHEYLLATGSRHPLGEKLYKEIVVPNKNVIAVLSGHYHESQLLVDELDDDHDGQPDRKVYQMLADYQAGPEGGQGFMRLLHFDTSKNRIIINTYSPYLDKYNYYDSVQYPGKDEFIIDLDLEPQEKLVATDYFAVNVYTDEEIDEIDDVKSGSIAEAKWKGLDKNNRYSWYVIVEDEFTGRTISDIWTFGKGNPSKEGKEENQGNKPDKEKSKNEDNKPDKIKL